MSWRVCVTFFLSCLIKNSNVRTQKDRIPIVIHIAHVPMQLRPGNLLWAPLGLASRSEPYSQNSLSATDCSSSFSLRFSLCLPMLQDYGVCFGECGSKEENGIKSSGNNNNNNQTYQPIKQRENSNNKNNKQMHNQTHTQ